MKQLEEDKPPQLSRLVELRESIGIEVQRIELKPNDLLIVRPKDETVRFSTQYCHWIMDVLNDYIKQKNNVKVILLAEHDTTLRVASPPESGEEYMSGWADALSALKLIDERSE